MLFLTRKENESIIITTEQEIITVKVINMYGKNVRIGIDAPRHVIIDREEIDKKRKGGNVK